MTTDETTRDPSTILSEIRKKSKLIHHLRTRANTGQFRSVGDAIALQRALRDREKLRGELPPFRLV
jgi:hypothetical protein